MLWTGSDDGLVYLSRDGGANWQNVTPSDLPEWSFIRTVEPSPHDPATLYLAATRYKLDDNRPFLYKTNDYGQSWQTITTGIPDDDFTRVIRADPNRVGLLYAGTESGLYVSFDDGGMWQRWQSNLPIVPIYDMTVKGTDLVLATHGRSFWIVDDLTLLHQASDAVESKPMHLFQPRRTWRLLPDLFFGWSREEGKVYGVGLAKSAVYLASETETGHVKRQFLDAGEGASLGAMITYSLSEDAVAQATKEDATLALAFLDVDGNLIREFKPKSADYAEWDEKKKSLDPGPWMPVNPGINRFLWDLRYAGATRVAGNKTAGSANHGPLILPGTYQVRLTIGDQTLTEAFEVVNDPRSTVSQADLQEQLTLLLQIRDQLSQTHAGVNRLRAIQEQVDGWRKHLAVRDDGQAICQAADELTKKLSAIESELILPGEQDDTFGLNDVVRLNAKLATVIPVVGSADAKPTEQARALAAEYSAQINHELEKLDDLVTGEVGACNRMIQEAAVPAVVSP